MSVQLNPYLHFQGNAREAMTFYQSVLGGELTMSTFGEFPQMPSSPELADQIMHGQLTLDRGITLMGSDTPPEMWVEPAGVTVSLSGGAAEEATLRAWFEGLGEGGTPGVPLEVAPWGDAFGMFTDKYGVEWLVNITGVGGSPDA